MTWHGLWPVLLQTLATWCACFYCVVDGKRRANARWANGIKRALMRAAAESEVTPVEIGRVFELVIEEVKP